MGSNKLRIEGNHPMAKTSMRSFGTSERIGHDSSAFYGRKIYNDCSQQTRKKSKKNNLINVPKISDSKINQIFNHSSENMVELKDNSVHLMVTSPPYNVGKDYEDDLTLEEYFSMLNRVWEETYRVLVPGGRACINIANVGRKPYVPLNYEIGNQMKNIGFLMRGEIIWNKSASAGTSCAWGSWQSASNPVLRDTHEYILIFCKERFNRNDSKDKKATINRDEFLNCTKSIWEMQTESAKKVKHPAPFPVELPYRLIQLYTFHDDIILDPFMGSGTTAVAAKLTERRWVGYEISEEYINVAHNRTERLF